MKKAHFVILVYWAILFFIAYLLGSFSQNSLSISNWGADVRGFVSSFGAILSFVGARILTLKKYE